MSRRLDVLQVIYGIQCVLAIDLPNADPDNDLGLARELIAEVFEAAHAVLSVSDFPDLLHAEERLRAALAACEPIYPHNEREAVDGLCVEESDDAR